MNPARTIIIRKTILQTLLHSKGYALEQSTLRSFVDALLRPPITDEEWSLSIDWLETNDHIARIPSDLDDALVQFAITERGRVLLQTL